MRIIKFEVRQPKTYMCYGWGGEKVCVEDKGKNVYFITDEDVKKE